MVTDFRFFSKRKGVIRIFTMVFSMIMLLCFGSCWLQWQIHENRTASLESWYGKWQAVVTDPSADDLKRLKNSKVIQTTGSVVTGESETGTGDSDFFDLADFSLKAGHLPVSDDEVAAETAWLDEHGLTYELGQTIAAGGRNRVLTGIVNPYRSTWIQGDSLPALWLSSVKQPESRLLYLQAKRGYEDFFDQIRTDGLLIQNVNLEGPWNPVSEQTLPYTVLGLFFFLVSVVLTAMLSDHYLKQYQRSISILKFLGIDSFMVTLDVALLFMKASLLPVVIMVIASLVLSVPFWFVSVTCGIYLLVLILALIPVFFFIRQIRSVNTTPDMKGPIPHFLPSPMEKITIPALVRRHISWNFSRIVMPLLAITFSAGLGASMLAWTMDAASYAATVKLEPDFTLYSDMPGLVITETESLVPDSVLNKIHAMKGVDQCFSFYRSWLWELSWEGMQSQSVIREIPDLNQANGQLISMAEEGFRLRPVLCELSDTPLKTAVLAESGIDPAQFETGNEVILYLPEFSATLEETGSETYELFGTDSERTGLRETSLQEGDSVTLTNTAANEVRTVTVGGIIRTPLNSDKISADRRSKITQAFATPYTVIVSSGFLKHSMINTVEIWMSEDRMPATETSLSTLAGQNHLHFQNDSARNGHFIQYFRNEEFLFLVLTVIAFSVMATITLWSARSERAAEESWLRQLKICDPEEEKQKEILRRYRGSRLLIFVFSLILSMGLAWILQIVWIPGLSVLRQGCASLFDPNLNPTGVLAIIQQSACLSLVISAAISLMIYGLACWINRETDNEE